MRRIKHKLNTLEEHGGINNIKRLNSGYGEEKYIITAVDNERFMLKIYSLDSEHDVQLDKEVNNRLSKLNVRTPLILEVGKTEVDLLPFELISWIDGGSLDCRLGDDSEETQYKKGVIAGNILRNIHELDYHKLCSSNHMALSERIKYAIDRYDLIKKDGHPIYKGDVFRDNILRISSNNTERSICMLHGDYHVGNIIEGKKGVFWVIDWIYSLIGDPVEDFVRIFVSADKSSEFARGQIDGYFEGAPPFSFWERLKMYAMIQQLEI